MADTSCSDSDFDKSAGLKNGKDLQREYVVAGSLALLKNSPVEAVDKFKAALEKMVIKSNQKIPMGQLLLKYALCIAWIKCNDYLHIAEAAGSLFELIDSGYASKLPALYLALARAYFALNRFKKALEFIEKGLKAIQSNSKIKQHSWPGLTTIIEETGKDILQKELLSLQENCNKCVPPDSLCNYDKCLEYSSHVLPSREIYFTDPDFHPFLYLRCEADCKIAYHNACWEHLKHVNHNLKDPKDLLGIPCCTDKCTASDNTCSNIVEVSLIGQNGFEKPLKLWSNTHSTQLDNKTLKLRNQPDHSTSYDKIDYSSSTESSNGSSDKCCLSALQGESNSEVTPRIEAYCTTVEQTFGCEEKPVSSVKAKSLEWKNPTPLAPVFSHVSRPYVPLPAEPNFIPQPVRPVSYYRGEAIKPYIAFESPPFPHCSQGPPVSSDFSVVPPSYLPVGGTYNPINTPCYGQPHQPFSHPLHSVQPLMAPRFLYHPTPVGPAAPCVKVAVRSASYLPAGTTLLVPIGPTGGNVHCIPNNQNTTEGSRSAFIPFVIEQQNASQAIQAREAPIKSVVDEFRRVVKKLSGEPPSIVSTSSKPVKESLPSCASSISVGASMKQVVEDFKKLVHDLAGSTTAAGGRSRAPKPLVEEELESKASCLEEQESPIVCATLMTPSPTPPTNLSPFVEDYPTHTSSSSVSSETSSDHLMMQESTLQAKSKHSQHKDIQYQADQLFVNSSSLESSLCSSQDDVSFEPIDGSRFAPLLEILSQCRAMKFGYLGSENVNPELQCFGHPDNNYSTPVSNINIPDDIDKADENQAQFVFSYYYSVFTNDGHYKIDDLQETWRNTSNELGLPETFTQKYSSLSEFLLKSERFAAIDDLIGTSDLLPNMFSKAEKELSESVSYLLSLQDSKSKEGPFSNDAISDLCKNHHNNIVNNSHTYLRAEELNGYDKSESDKIRSRDRNDNAISRNSFTVNSNLGSSQLLNGCLKLPSEPNIISKPEKVYMSDDDEEIDVSLTGIDKEHSSCQGSYEVMSQFQMPADYPKGIAPVPTRWSEGETPFPNKTDKVMQTDHFIDTEKEKLLREKESLRKEVSELKYEKAELHQRVESLQSQMESTLANRESQHSKSLKHMQEKLEEKLKKKSEELKELREKISVGELELNQAKEHVKEKESQVAERDAHLDKLRRNHAKEINNSVKKLLEDKQHKEEEFRDTLKRKDQNYIQLWKDFCEFKIKKFNHLCNDRINVLSQLRDLMSDTVQPTKSDVKCSMEKYEELMISVNKKNAEVNEVFIREMDRVASGMQVLLPSPIDVPDIMNMLYPPEGAFEYLVKTKQEEFGVPRNLFSPAFSRFYRPYGSNGAQPVTQSRETEGYSSIPNSSLFSQGRNETSHLWSNSFSAPSNNLSGMSYEVSNSNGPQLPIPQGFSSPSSLIVQQQPSLNLMPNVMSYQSSSSQNVSVQGMMGQNRSNPSPSPFSSVNGSVFNTHPSTASAIGTKPPGIGIIQKPIPSALPSSPAVKSTPQMVSANTPVAVTVQGAIPKPRVQTATASMTPIVPSKGLVRPAVKIPKCNESNYEKLMRNLQKMFPTRNDMELTQALKMAREKNGNTLSSLSYSEIISKVEEILNKSRKQTSMGWEKFGQAAWGTAKPNVIEWEGSVEEECCICMNSMNAEEVYTLECKHAFHKQCIRPWLVQNSVCPTCRTHSTMLDEFPPLA